MSKKQPVVPDSWEDLNYLIMGTTDEGTLHDLLEAERCGKARQQFVKRIHSRLNKVRADRERKELEK